MKNRQVKTSNTQRGFAMLEVMLAVLIIAIASFGIYKLFSQSTDRSNVATVESTINQVAAAVNRYATANLAAPTSMGDLITSGYLNTEILKCTDKTNPGTCTAIPSAYGDITFGPVSGGAYNAFTLTTPKLQTSIANELITDLKNVATGHQAADTGILTLTFPAS